MKYPLSSILQEERKDMTIRECYEKTGSDYENILKRFGSEAMIQRFALKFLKDGSFSDLKDALEAKDGERAFRAAHTLKGICLNLGLDRLYKVSACLTEKLRGREFNGYEEAYEEVQQEYQNTVDAIRTMAE